VTIDKEIIVYMNGKMDQKQSVVFRIIFRFEVN